jgi:hypothetical protein
MSSATLPFSTEPANTIGQLPSFLRLELTVEDPPAIATLWEYQTGDERNRFALRALQIGLQALDQARSRIDADTIRREGAHILELLDKRLGEHERHLNERMGRTLAEYFDPNSGRFDERVKRLVQDGGDLEQVLRRAVAPEGSALARTLIQHVGEQSPLLRLLDPKSSEGICRALEGAVTELVERQREAVLREFSLDNDEGALVRLLGELKERHGELQEWMREQVGSVVGEFSMDKEDSVMRRLVLRVEAAQKAMTQEFSLDNDCSALSRLQRQLEQTRSAINRELTLDDGNSALSRLRRELTGLLDDQGTRNAKFQEEVTRTLAQFTARKGAEARSVEHGHAFEDAVQAQVRRMADARNDVFEPCGQKVGEIRHSKVGDAVVTLGPDSVAAGCRIVVEAKEDASYTLADAREELDKARKNRKASIGLFVFSRKVFQDDEQLLRKFEDNIIVIWDAEDPGTDVILHAGLELARALAVRAAKAHHAQKADIDAIDAAVLEIERTVENLGKVATWADTIKSNSQKILDRVAKDRETLEAKVEVLREKVAVIAAMTHEGVG